MAHDQVSFNDKTYIDNLASLDFEHPGTSLLQYANIMSNALNVTNSTQEYASAATTILRTFNKTSHPLPTTLSGLISQLFPGGTFVGSDPFLIGGPPITITAAQFTDALFQDYKASVNANTDWSLISPPPDFNAQFNKWFEHFLATYPYQSNGAVLSATGSFYDFLNAMAKELQVIAGMRSTSTLSRSIAVGNGLFSYAPVEDPRMRYEDIYNAMFPNGDFQARLNQFYNEKMAQFGYFIPSQFLADWTHEISTEFSKTLGASGFLSEGTSLESMDAKKALILDRIFLLIASMLNTLQRLTAAQAQRLFILTNWQRAYTDALAQMPTFLAVGNPITRLSDSNTTNPDPDKAKRRDELNTFNSTKKEVMTNDRNVISDDAKALQSNLNQSNDAVSQQANMATAILQELSTMLGAIFR